ncbi:uncharacterized protein [Venturia canescens]|uniref:uncharacterized protein n=1 Tax=Venturia canescens TaxID=32260 RepID=UPI001C9D4B8F|nr:uncharacterized protein LOC122413351 [Venturia canescens]
MLIDTGAEITFITASLVQQLKLHREASVIPIIGIGGTHSGHTRGVVSVKLRSMHSSDIVSIKAHILSKLMPTLPSFTPPNISLSHLQGLPLADPEFLSPESIDLILGADIYGQLIREQIKRGPHGTPIAQNTVFGWIVLGPMDSSQQSAGLVHHAAVDHGYQELQDLLTQFWVQEEVSGSGESHLTPDEQECETHFLTTHKRDSDGRYVVRLPVKSASGTLGGSFHTASSCLHRLQCKLNRDSSYKGLYDTFLGEYESLGHMTRVSGNHAPLGPIYYLPHHGVLTTKLLVVFNGSCNTDSGISLNDILHTGAKLQRDISDVLLWVRRHRFVFATDIVKMFRQIRVHESDWDLQRILWVDEGGRVVPFHLTTVTYGTRSAPFLVGRALDQLVTDEGGKYPEAVAPLTKGRYVDDIYGGADQLADLITQAEQLIGICTAGCFPLAKWQSNHPELLTAVGATSSMENARYTAGDGITKRIILSEIAQLYDPLGFLSPVTIRAKVLLQRLWLEKLNWDDLVSTEVRNSWVAFRQELSHLGTVSVPRWLNIATGTSVELHGFSDASQLAMGAAVYVRVSGAGNQTTVSLVCAKTKVAPIKRLTIPRLELAAAVLLAKLTHHVQNVLGLDDSRVYLWTDSMVTLTWVTSHPSRWKDFVRNRVSLAQELVPRAQWRFTPGRDNPADCASRGLTILQLARHSSWWDGPHWLAKDSFHWPTHRIGTGDAAALEERPGLTLSLATSPSPVYDLILKYSSLTRLLRITSWLFKVITNLKRAGDGTSGSANITPGDLENSRLYWVKAIQGAYFTSELKTLTSGYTLPKSHPITRLTGFIDHQGILRVGGRLKHSALQPDCKHSVILPRDSPLTALLIADAHERTLHGGTQLTLAYLRQSCWIIGGRGPVRSYILRCVRCARFRALKAQQLMGQLPISRVTPARPFLFSGVDYAGPVSLKSWRGRGSKCHKGWLCIFVCFATSAMHLEVVTDLTTDGFLAALRRFTGRRGIPHTIQSDCGTNFQGAAAELRQLFKTGTRESELIQHTGATDGIKWVFNPPGAPHMGGKWEAAVKSVKYHLRRTIGDASLTFEEFTTLLTQIEGILNSRPLEPLSDDPDDYSVLTPGHFLIGDTLTSIPEPSLRDVPQGRLTRWQWLQERVQYYWEHWSSGYLQRQQAISKWHHPSHDIRVGSMVLLMNENTSPTKWPRARVTQLHPGKDGLTRVVTLKTATTTLTRPITKLALLPVPQPGSIDSTAADGGRNVQD